MMRQVLFIYFVVSLFFTMEACVAGKFGDRTAEADDERASKAKRIAVSKSAALAAATEKAHEMEPDVGDSIDDIRAESSRQQATVPPMPLTRGFRPQAQVIPKRHVDAAEERATLYTDERGRRYYKRAELDAAVDAVRH